MDLVKHQFLARMGKTINLALMVINPKCWGESGEKQVEIEMERNVKSGAGFAVGVSE